MKEAGDGLHAQMNSMMGALQELKLLQVQTALDNLDITGRPINRGIPHRPDAATGKGLGFDHSMPPVTNPSPVPSQKSGNTTTSRESSCMSQSGSSMGTSTTSSSSFESCTNSSRSSTSANKEPIPKRWSGYTAPQVDFCGPTVGNPSPEPCSHLQSQRRSQTVDLPGILYSLSKEGPSMDSECNQDNTDDSSDWTSSLMNQRRNRQPLVLGDNVFADLVGNWLDLPEVEREDMEEDEMRKEDAKNGNGMPDKLDSRQMHLSRSQEFCRKFTLTTNIFKKFLRSVRPDRDKLLKERPGWPEMTEGDLFKRPKKAGAKGSKGSFYLPFWANGQQGKSQPNGNLNEVERHQLPQQQHFPQCHQQTFPGIYLDSRQPQTAAEDRMQPLFDYNTAVWV
ncbi:unnamed protein product [Knipowitschia caucasica]|uniref:PAK4-inhibitor INKA2 n=1 Tax=Knipowitschia caucasica TaxID=637954 RepID=A0AAV2M8T5_KNICA